MKYTSTLIAVKDMDISKQFYHNVLGLNVVANFGANVTLDGGIVLQTLDTWKSFIRLYEHRWGQRVIRFYDPDKHIIAVGEKLDAVVLRFIEQGLSPEQTAVRMDIPLNFVLSSLNK